MECRVAYDQMNHELDNDHFEEVWVNDLDNKRIEVIDLAKRILNQDVDTYTFEVAFSGDFDFDDESDFEVLMTVLADIESGSYSDLKLTHFVVMLALDAAAFCLYDLGIEELLSDSYDELYMANEVLDEIDLL